MKNNGTKKLFLENLKKVPIIQVACEKAGVSRATVYRWRDKDKKFRKALDEALSEGEALVNDMSESQLISLIKEKSFPAVRFWLNHRHKKFKERVEVTTKTEDQEKLSSEQQKIVKEALKLASFGKKKLSNKKS